MRDHIAKIVAAYTKGNALPSGQLPALIRQLAAVLGGLNQPVRPTAPTPAVPVRQSVLPDAVICLDCGWRGKILRGHVRAAHGLSPAAYRKRWGFKSNHPLVAPNYSKRRSVIARSLGLGWRLTKSKQATGAAPTKPAGRERPARSGRPLPQAPSP